MWHNFHNTWSKFFISHNQRNRTMWSILFGTLGSIGSLVFVLGFLIKYKNRWKIPGMKPSDPKEGNLRDIKQAGGMASFLVKLHQAYGPIASFWEKNKMAVSIASPEYMMHQSCLFNHPEEVNEKFRILLGNEHAGLKNLKEAERRRKLYEEHLIVKAFSSYNRYFNEIAHIEMASWHQLDPHEELHLMSVCSNIALRSILRTTFGDHFNNETKFANFKNKINSVLSLTDQQPEEGTVERNIFLKNVDTIRRTIEEIMNLRREQGTSTTDEKYFIDVLLEKDLTDQQRISDALTLLASGYETVVYTLIWIIYEICRDGELQNKIYEEIVNVFDDGHSMQENISQLKILRQVIDECLRLHFRTLYMGRVSESKMMINRYVIPANTNIYYAIGFMFHDPLIWPEPEKFDYKRFDTNNINERCSYAFIPFGLMGKRHCPGWAYAYTEIIIVLSELCRNYEFRLASKNVENSFEDTCSNLQNSLWINIRPRNLV